MRDVYTYYSLQHFFSLLAIHPIFFLFVPGFPSYVVYVFTIRNDDRRRPSGILLTIRDKNQRISTGKKKVVVSEKKASLRFFFFYRFLNKKWKALFLFCFLLTLRIYSSGKNQPYKVSVLLCRLMCDLYYFKKDTAHNTAQTQKLVLLLNTYSLPKKMAFFS